MYTVYVVQNTKNKKYIGSTNDLADRLRMHNDVSLEKIIFHRTTYRKGPWKIIFSKEFADKKDALKFEKFLKMGQGREWLKNILG